MSVQIQVDLWLHNISLRVKILPHAWCYNKNQLLPFFYLQMSYFLLKNVLHSSPKEMQLF